jgi:hypothetical protein
MSKPSHPRITRSILVPAIVCAGLLASSVAGAGKRVVILDFEGPGNRTARAAVARVLRGNHVVVPQAQLRSEASKLKMQCHCDPLLVQGLASLVHAEAVVCGALPARRNRLTLTVYNGGDGQKVKVVATRLGRTGVSGRVLVRLHRQVEQALAKTWNWEGVEVSKDKKSAPSLSWEESAPPPAMPERNVAAALPDTNAWENDDTENPLNRPKKTRKGQVAVVKAKPQTPRRAEGAHALRLGAGPAFLFRRNYGVYEAARPMDAQGWKTSPVAGIALSGEVFPAAWFTKGWASNIGLGLAYSRYFGLTWKMNNDPEEHSATHQVLSVDLRGRYRLPIGRRHLLFSAHFGYRYLGFTMNDTAEVRAVVPDVTFSSLDLGAAIGFSVLPKWLTISARFSYLPVLDRGEIATAEEYGSGTGGGMVFGGSVSGAIAGPVGWQLDFDYARYAIVFDDPAATRQAEMARDRYISSILSVTYAL